MTPSVRRKLEALAERYQELTLLLADPGVLGDPGRYRDLSREYSELGPVARAMADFDSIEQGMKAARELAADPDAGMRALASEELEQFERRQQEITGALQLLLIPKDPHDERNVFLELRAGTGGDEAALFVGDLFRMYQRYAERRGWQVEVLSASAGEHGGYKELVARVSGQGVYARLKFESGTHRVQRVPETEAQGRIHTSAATIAILPELDEVEDVALNPAELKVDTFRASGAGGQHVNKTDSAIRITHLPSGIVVECQDERSQHKNRARAMSLLKARLLDSKREKQTAAQSESRRLQVGSGDRSQRIRTYNFPQGRLTDHRIGLTLYALEDILHGNLDLVLEPLAREHEIDQLKSLGDAG